MTWPPIRPMSGRSSQSPCLEVGEYPFGIFQISKSDIGLLTTSPCKNKHRLYPNLFPDTDNAVLYPIISRCYGLPLLFKVFISGSFVIPISLYAKSQSLKSCVPANRRSLSHLSHRVHHKFPQCVNASCRMKPLTLVYINHIVV